MCFQSNATAESAELFVNCLEAMVETCLPGEEGEMELVQYPSMLSVSSNMNLSSSLSSLTLGSPTDKGKYFYSYMFTRIPAYTLKDSFKNCFKCLANFKVLIPWICVLLGTFKPFGG